VKASEPQAQSERIPTKSPGHSEMMSEDPRVIEPRSGPADLLLQGCWLPDGRGPRDILIDGGAVSEICQKSGQGTSPTRYTS
jgi:hypothetical protein